MCPAFGVFCPVYMCVLVCTFVEEVSADSLAATTPFVAPRSKIGKLLMQIRLIRGAKRSAEKFRFCGGVGTPEILGPPPPVPFTESLPIQRHYPAGCNGPGRLRNLLICVCFLLLFAFIGK